MLFIHFFKAKTLPTFTATKPNGKVLLVEERATGTWESPYKFNGKEIDQETGLYYVHARYRDPQHPTWYGVDPLYLKYPGMSGYVYCANNPVRFIDPDGRDIVYINTSGVEVHRIKNDKIFQTHIQTTSNATIQNLNTGWKEVPMPNIIQTRTASGESVSGTSYQKNDYLIT